MTRYFIGIGSNENAMQSCIAMIKALHAEFQQVSLSCVVKTPAYGWSAPDYLNAVLCFESDLSVSQLRLWCKSVEKSLGRTSKPDGLCSADLDILQPNNVQEPFFQPLVKQLQAYLHGQVVTIEALPVELFLGEDIRVGTIPCHLPVAEYA